MSTDPEGPALPPLPPGPAAGGSGPDRDAMPAWVPRALLMFFGGVAALFVLRWLMTELRGLLIMLFVSMFLSFAIEPAVNWLAARGWRRGAGTWAMFVALLVVSVGFLVSIGTVLVRQLVTLVENAPGYLEQLQEWADDRFGIDISTDRLVEQLTEAEGPLRDLAGDVAQNALGFSAAVLGGVFQVFSVALFTWYLVADGPRLRRSILSTLPPHRQQRVLDTWDLAITKTGGYIYSRLLLSLVSAATTWLALTLIGVPYPVPLALWVGVISQFVPVVGAYLAGAMPVLVALVASPLRAALALGFIVVYQQVENYLLAPRITARTMALHPAVAFGTVIAGAALLGPIGAVLALPAAAILQAFGSALIDRHEVVESALTAEPAARPEPRWRSRFGKQPPGD